jgi:hypothetical protein
MLARECLARAIFVRRPVHCFLRYVYWATKFIGTRRSQKYVIAGYAASEHGGPAVYLRDIGVRENLKCDVRQYAANDDSLHYIRKNGSIEHQDTNDGPPEHASEHPFASIS